MLGTAVRRLAGVAGKPVWVVLAVALLVGALVRLGARRNLQIDETVSFLAAACQQVEYARLRADVAPPFARWVPASEWQKFLEPASFGCLHEISRGLVETDMHPPLYFWLLHFWLYLVPAGLATGPSLNAPIVLGTAVLLFLLAQELFEQPLVAAFAVLAWIVNPCGIEVTQFARPYELLSLFTVLLAWRSARWVHRVPAREALRREGAILFGTSLAGLLTHYSFVFVVAAAGAYLLFGLGFKRAITPVAIIALGLMASNVLHPTFRAMFFGRHERPAPVPARTQAITTLFNRVVSFFDFNGDVVAQARPGHTWIGPTVLAALAAATVWLAVRQRWLAVRQPGAERRTDVTVDLRFLVLPAVLVALLAGGIALGFVPVHATHPRHLAFFWPLFGLLVAYPFALLQTSERLGGFVVAGGSVVLSAAALFLLPRWTNPWTRYRAPYEDCERVLVPGSRRTWVFRAVLGLDPEVLVLAGNAPDVERALSAESPDEVCVAKGEDSPRVLRALAKHHVDTTMTPSPGRAGRRKHGARPKSRDEEPQDQPADEE
jgi:hypothetical protein